ncbi:hypothetical protein GF342_06110 [Candidatus Woesearchaeota archaeon]|nr:hypothetical protein [Candidatus Woesearchaeota archaeon]
MQPVTHPAVGLVALLYLGMPMFYYLSRALSNYFHWYFYPIPSVVSEIKEIMLVYATFLVLAIIASQVLQDKVLLALLAVVLPLLAAIAAVSLELYVYVANPDSHNRNSNYHRKVMNNRKL